MKINHSSEVLSCLKSCVNDSTFSDVKILVGKEKKIFYASSLLLGIRSPIFKAMFFTSGLKEQRTKELELPDANPTSFIYFLEYLTTGEVELTGQNIFDILELSDKYRFEKLYLECKEYLNKGITIQNCLGMLENGIRLNLEETINGSWKIIDKETEQFLNNENNLSINFNTMDLLLSRNSLNIREINLFRFLIKWGKKQKQERNSSSNNSNASVKDIVKPYLRHIRFPLMNFKELIREVRPLGVIDDLQYIEALEFNGDKESFNIEGQIKNEIQFQERERIEREIGEINLDECFILGPNYSLSANNKIVTKNNGGDSWNCTCIGNLIVDKGIHRWSLKILNSSYPQNPRIMIGIAPHNINQSDTHNYSKSGWYLYCSNGTLYSGPPFNYNNKACHGSNIPVGSIIDVELDISRSTIKYFINGVDKGIAYQEIPLDQPLKLAINIRTQEESIQLLSHSEYLEGPIQLFSHPEYLEDSDEF